MPNIWQMDPNCIKAILLTTFVWHLGIFKNILSNDIHIYEGEPFHDINC